MEDTQDKVRRNVVMLSALIIFFWFLDLKLSNDLTPMGIALIGKASPMKLWACITAVLIYAILRYRFDDETKKQITHISAETTQFREEFVLPRLVKSATYLLQNGTAKSTASNFSFKDSPNSPGRSLSQLLKNRPLKELELTVAPLHWSTWSRHGTAQFSGAVTGEGLDRHDNIFNCSFHVPLPIYVDMWTRVALRIALYSKSSIDVLVPFVLASVAFGVCLTKLVAAA